MKKLIFTSLLHFLCITLAFAQVVAVENSEGNIVYPQLDNPLTIVAAETSCEQLWVSTNNGNIKKNRRTCRYELRPKEVGTASIFVSKVEGLDTILLSEKKFKVLPWPQHQAEIGGKKNNVMTMGEFKAQMGVSIPIQGFRVDGIIPVNSFRVRIIRRGIVIAEAINEGGKFEKKTYLKLNRMMSNDKIIFDEIMTTMPGSKEETEAKGFEITIKDKPKSKH